MKGVHRVAKGDRISRTTANRAPGSKPQTFAFCDKKSGAARFTVEADRENSPPLDRMAGSLAVYCIAHYCSPADLTLVVRADDTLRENVCARAAALLDSARVGTASVALSPREREVLRAVNNNFGNKEIAYRLSISVRTVKFHVSALLAKFGVQTRSQLFDFSSARMFDSSKSSGERPQV